MEPKIEDFRGYQMIHSAILSKHGIGSKKRIDTSVNLSTDSLSSLFPFNGFMFVIGEEDG